MKKLPEQIQKDRGENLIEILRLRRDPSDPTRVLTTWGNKTPLGLFRTIERIIKGK